MRVYGSFRVHNTERSPRIEVFESQQSPAKTSEFTDNLLEATTQRTQRANSFLPSIRIGSNNARKLLFESNESMSGYSNKLSLHADLPPKERFNMSMMVPNGSKLTSAPLEMGKFNINNAKGLYASNRKSLINDRTYSSNTMNNSVVSDRLVDYKNQINTRRHNMSMHEQFNLEILTNPIAWGEQIPGKIQDNKPHTSKYKSKLKKNLYVATENLLVTKRRVLNHKRKDFWNLNLQNKTTLPPPPLGQSFGHGILSTKINKSKEEDTEANVSSYDIQA